MSYTQIMFRSTARERILHGATMLADAVRVTLGPTSKSVLVAREWGPPLLCNDGLAIAREVSFDDPEENLGARMMREAAEKTGELVGDGTTTATLLAYAMFSEGLSHVMAGASAMDIKRGLERGLKAAVQALRALSRPGRSGWEQEPFEDALPEGFVPGAGLALLRAIDAVEREEATATTDERAGLRILKHALEVPTRQLAENSGAEGGAVVERMRHGQGSEGFDATSGQYVDLFEAGIIDPTRVLRVAMENAVSVASVLLLTEATLTEAKAPAGERAAAAPQ